MPFKKRRLVNGQQLMFRQPGEESDSEDEEQDVGPMPSGAESSNNAADVAQQHAVPVVETQRIIIHEED